jgi:hypothetical protein
VAQMKEQFLQLMALRKNAFKVDYFVLVIVARIKKMQQT